MKQKKIVITGGPGTGKSTVIENLIEQQFTCMPEISRKVTQDAQKSGIDQLFLKDPLLFSELLLDGRIRQYRKADEMSDATIFFDRGIPDVLAYLNYLKTDFPREFMEKCAAHNYDIVFIMPPWKNIYKTDNERYESFNQALSIHDKLIEMYESLDYKPITVPPGHVKSRSEFITNLLFKDE